MTETNKCDKCNIEMSTYDLIWITAEDFKPKFNEKLPKDFFNKGYDALCEACYLEELRGDAE